MGKPASTWAWGNFFSIHVLWPASLRLASEAFHSKWSDCMLKTQGYAPLREALEGHVAQLPHARALAPAAHALDTLQQQRWVQVRQGLRAVQGNRRL